MATSWRLLRQPLPPRTRDDSVRRRHRGRGLAMGAVHPGWGYHAEELLFYTSRYYARTETFLRNVSGVADFTFDGYRAQRLAPAQREAVARLLRRPVGHVTARAVVALMRRITLCRGRRIRGGRSTRRRPAVPPDTGIGSRPHRLDGMSPSDPFLAIAARFGLQVHQHGRHLWVSFNALRRLLDARNPALRSAVHEAVETLHDGGFHLHRRRSG